jgi:protein TonB
MLYYKYFHADSPIVLHQQGPSVMTTVELDPTQVVPPPEIKAPVIAPPSFVPPKVVDNVDNNATEFGPTDIAIETSTNQKPDDNLNNLPPQTAPEDIPDEIPTVTIAEEPAMFRGGELSAFNKWVQQQLVYPQRALDEHIEGRVTVAFNVGPKGIINDIAIVRSVDPLLDNEVIRVLNQSPLWTEPRQGGKVVKQHFFMPVFFKIQE